MPAIVFAAAMLIDYYYYAIFSPLLMPLLSPRYYAAIISLRHYAAAVAATLDTRLRHIVFRRF